MAWNWQLKDWPEFAWDQRKLARAETIFAEGAGVAIGAAKHLSDAQREHLTVDLMSHEAIDTSAIEGVSDKEAESRAWATVNKEDGGGKNPGGSGRGKAHH